MFWIKDEKIFTPPLSEGCIAGVMRKHLMQTLEGTRYKVQERQCDIVDMENADEVFFTNAVQGIRWVKQFRGKTYCSTITKEVYQYIK